MSVPLAYVGIVIIWSTTPLAIKWSGEDVGFLFGVSLRMFIALLVCFLILTLMRRKIPLHKQAIHLYFAVGLPLYSAMICVYWAAQSIPSGLISVLFGLTPIFTGVLATIYLAEKSFSLAKLIGLIISFIGLIVIFHRSLEVGEAMAWGMAGTVLAAFLHSLGTVWVKNVVGSLPVLTANTGGLVVAVFLFFITWMLMDASIPANIPDHAAYSIIYLSIVGSVFGAVLFYFALKNVSAMSMGLLPLITPVIALFIGQQLNDEQIEISTLFGTALILSGLVIYQWITIIFESVKKAKIYVSSEMAGSIRWLRGRRSK